MNQPLTFLTFLVKNQSYFDSIPADFNKMASKGNRKEIARKS